MFRIRDPNHLLKAVLNNVNDDKLIIILYGDLKSDMALLDFEALSGKNGKAHHGE